MSEGCHPRLDFLPARVSNLLPRGPWTCEDSPASKTLGRGRMRCNCDSFVTQRWSPRERPASSLCRICVGRGRIRWHQPEYVPISSQTRFRTGGWSVGATDEGYRRSPRNRSTVGNIIDGGFRGDVSRVTGKIMELSGRGRRTGKVGMVVDCKV